jgi:hypothetical protein
MGPRYKDRGTVTVEGYTADYQLTKGLLSITSSLGSNGPTQLDNLNEEDLARMLLSELINKKRREGKIK